MRLTDDILSSGFVRLPRNFALEGLERSDARFWGRMGRRRLATTSRVQFTQRYELALRGTYISIIFQLQQSNTSSQERIESFTQGLEQALQKHTAIQEAAAQSPPSVPVEHMIDPTLVRRYSTIPMI